jgi:hypothetical protein
LATQPRPYNLKFRARPAAVPRYVAIDNAYERLTLKSSPLSELAQRCANCLKVDGLAIQQSLNNLLLKSASFVLAHGFLPI